MEGPLFDVGTVCFSSPVKRIFDSQGTQNFQSSVAIYRLKWYLSKYIHLVQSHDIPQVESSAIPIVNSMLSLLSTLSTMVDDTPPLPGPRRYGNLACRDWHSKLEQRLPDLLSSLSSEPLFQKSTIELRYYLSNSFGSSTRLDYGTGHELSFLAVIAAIDMLSLWTNDFQGSDLLLILNAYYKLVRKLILTYTLEPAGSHGVWGLDDHFHLAYIFGSAQWCNVPKATLVPLQPSDITRPNLIQDHCQENLFCQAINFIDVVKSGPFNEHSPILYDIAKRVHTWSKVHTGLVKMYNVEVLNKFPVVQHFWFGDGFFPWIDYHTGNPLPVYENDSSINDEPISMNSINTAIPTMAMPTNQNTTPIRTRMPPPNLTRVTQTSTKNNSLRRK